MKQQPEPTIFELSASGRIGMDLPAMDVPETALENLIPADLYRKKAPELPEVSEIDVVRHYTRLSNLNHGVDTGFYPLGSCTMKYNPKVNEDMARLPGFALAHPYQPEELSQGSLELMFEMENYLAEITGMDQFTLQPAAGAHGEITGIMIVKAYHAQRGDHKRTKVIVPDAAHGTNPATAAQCGFEIIQVKSNFTFTPIRGTRLEKRLPPVLDHYRRIQAARYLMVKGLDRFERLVFSDGKLTAFGLEREKWLSFLADGEAFRTSGCPDCNRPYYNEKPGGVIYNYPKPLTEEQGRRALAEIGI